MSEYRFLKIRREGAALVVELTNPPRNLLNAPMVAELTALADEAERNSEVRALILTGGVGEYSSLTTTLASCRRCLTACADHRRPRRAALSCMACISCS